MIKVCGPGIKYLQWRSSGEREMRSWCHSCQQCQRQMISSDRNSMLTRQFDFGSYQSLSWSYFLNFQSCLPVQCRGAAASQVDAEQTFGPKKAAYLAAFMATTAAAVERATVHYQLSAVFCYEAALIIWSVA
jgi:hypothetical protein